MTTGLDNRPDTFSGRRASQIADELDAFIELLLAEGAESYGEVGAREGDTFHAIMLRLPERSRGVALDLPGGLWGKTTTRGQLEAAVAHLVDRGYRASCLFGDSKAAATRRQFAGRGPYDAILIDGDHTLAGVTADWERYRDLAPVVAFHDIVGTGEAFASTGDQVEVPILWESIKASGLRTAEFVAPGSRMGIGVVWTR